MKFELEMLPFAFEAEAQGEQQEARRPAARSAARAARSGSTAGAGRTSARTVARARPRPRGRPIVGSRVYYPIPVYNPFAQGGAWPEPAPAAEPAPAVQATPPVAEPAAAPTPGLAPEPFAYPPATDTTAAGDGGNTGPDADASAAGNSDTGNGDAGNGDAGNGDAGDGAAEIPQAIFDFLRNNRTNAQIPQYDGYKTGLKRQGKPIQDVVNDPALKGQSGVYLITFDHAGKRRAYSGKAKDLQARLKQHLATLSFPVGLQRQYKVYVQPTANVALARSLERQINQRRAQFGQALVNRTTELEFALFA